MRGCVELYSSTPLAHKLARIIWHLVTHRVGYDESIFAEREEQLLRRKQRQHVDFS